MSIADFHRIMTIAVQTESSEDSADIIESSKAFAEVLGSMVEAGLTVDDFMELQKQVTSELKGGE